MKRAILICLLLAGCSASQQPRLSPGPAARSGNEIPATAAFRAALAGDPIPNLPKVRKLAALNHPQNQAALACAGLQIAGHVADCDRVTRLSQEVGSGLYWGSWTLAAFCSGVAPEACKSQLAWSALNLVPANRFELHDLTGVHSRSRNYGMAHYSGPVSMSPSNRALWDRGKVALYAERSLAGPAAARALGQSWSWSGWDHLALGWAMRAIRDGPRVTLPQDPTALAALVRLPLNEGQRFDLFLGGDRKLGVLSKSTASTRGAVLVTEFEGDTLRWYSPAEPTTQGRWTAVRAEVTGDTWSTWQAGNSAKRLSGTVPANAVHIVWDGNGARVEGAAPPPPPPPPPATLPREINDALLAFDRFCDPPGSKAGKIQRTAIELARRALLKRFEGAESVREGLPHLKERLDGN